MSNTEDELRPLIQPAVDGDKKALQQIIRIIHPLVLRYVRSRVGYGRVNTPEDIAQEACLGVANSMPNYIDRGRPFMAYVYGIASNKVTDSYRVHARDQSSPTDGVPEGMTREGNPEEATLEIDGSNRMRALLDSLSERAREIIILRVFVGLTADETAAIVGIAPGAVRVAQHRALAALRKKLEEEEERE